ETRKKRTVRLHIPEIRLGISSIDSRILVKAHTDHQNRKADDQSARHKDQDQIYFRRDTIKGIQPDFPVIAVPPCLQSDEYQADQPKHGPCCRKSRQKRGPAAPYRKYTGCL